MRKIKDFLLLNNVFGCLHAEDIVGRQRLLLFRWFTLLGLFTCAGLLVDMYSITAMLSLRYTVPALAVLFVLNYALLHWHKNTKLAYITLITLILLEIHNSCYFLGGVRNNGMFFSAAALLAAFMLLGTRSGFTFSIIVIVNYFYFYFIGLYTDWVSDLMLNQSIAEINLDYLITGTICLIVIASQLISLEGSKNKVLITLNQSRRELRNKNAELQGLIAERKKSSQLLGENVHHLEKINRELEQKNQDLDRFAYLVSHDLKAPLRAISSMTKFIEEDAIEKLPPETHHYLDIIRGRIMRMEKLINDILSYSQSTRSKKQFTEFTLNEVVHETIDLIMLPANCKVEVQGGTTRITSDQTRLQQVILNLLVNAIKHHHNKNEIVIKVSVCDELTQWHFSIRDNGPGIDVKYHDKIFQIFQTVNAKKDDESTGIGLAIVKRIVNDLDGKIWIESSPGNGTTFHFTQPKENVPAPTPEPELALR